MAEIQMIQLRGQTAAASKKTNDSGLQADFSGMLKEKSQSVSEQKKTSQAADESSVQTPNKDNIQEPDRDKEQVTDADGQQKAEQGLEEELDDIQSGGQESGLAAELTAAEMAQLAQMMNALSRNQAGSGQQEEAMQQVEAVQQETMVSEMAQGLAETEEALASGVEQALEENVEDMEEIGALEDGKLQALAGDGDEPKTVIASENSSRLSEETSAVGGSPVVLAAEKGSKDQLQQSDLGQQGDGSAQAASAAGQVAGERFSAAVHHSRAESSAVLQTSPETLPVDVSETIASKMPLQGGTSTLELTLEPASLGKITIRMIYEGGKAAVSLIADNPRTLEILSQRAGEIAQILEEKTGQATVVYTPESQYTEDDGNRNQGRNQQQEQRERPRQDQADTFAQQLRLGLV